MLIFANTPKENESSIVDRMKCGTVWIDENKCVGVMTINTSKVSDPLWTSFNAVIPLLCLPQCHCGSEPWRIPMVISLISTECGWKENTPLKTDTETKIASPSTRAVSKEDTPISTAMKKRNLSVRYAQTEIFQSNATYCILRHTPHPYNLPLPLAFLILAGKYRGGTSVATTLS